MNGPLRADATALLDLLARLTRLQEELAIVMRCQFAAMKSADVSGMQSAAAREALLVQSIGRLDAQRHVVIGRLVAARALPTGDAVTLGRIAEAFDEPDRNRVLALAQGLRRSMSDVAELNRVIALIRGERLARFRSVFLAMTRSGRDLEVYSRRGRVKACAGRLILNAVG